MPRCLSVSNKNNEKLSPGLQHLIDEHIQLLKLLDELLVFVHNIENNLEIVANFTKLTEKVLVFFHHLKPHSEKEENILFPMIKKYVAREWAPLKVMEREHREATIKLHQFLKTTKDKHSIISEDTMKYLALLINQVYKILTEHFAKEENVLFPLTEKKISLAEKEILNRKLIN